MSTPTPPQGFLGLPDLDDIIGQVTKLLPPVVTDAIKDTVDKLIDPDEPLNIGDPQPGGDPPIPVEPGSHELSTAVKAIDGAVSAIDLVLKFSFIIPDSYEGPLRALQGALRTIRGWLD